MLQKSSDSALDGTSSAGGTDCWAPTAVRSHRAYLLDGAGETGGVLLGAEYHLATAVEQVRSAM